MPRTSEYHKKIVGPRFARWASSARNKIGISDYKLAQALQEIKGSKRLTGDTLQDRQTAWHLIGEKVPNIDTTLSYGKAFRQLNVGWLSPNTALFVSGYIPQAAANCAQEGEVATFALGLLAYVLECEEPFAELVALLQIDTQKTEERIVRVRSALARTNLRHKTLLDPAYVLKSAILDHIRVLRPSLYMQVSFLCDELDMLKKEAMPLISVFREKASPEHKLSSFLAQGITRQYTTKRPHHSNAKIYRDFGDEWFFTWVAQRDLDPDHDKSAIVKHLSRLYEHNLTLLDVFATYETLSERQSKVVES